MNHEITFFTKTVSQQYVQQKDRYCHSIQNKVLLGLKITITLAAPESHFPEFFRLKGYRILQSSALNGAEFGVIFARIIY